MRIGRSRWTWVGTAEAFLFGLLLLFVAGCNECEPGHTFADVKWKGKIWKTIWYKEKDSRRLITVISPNGTKLEPDDPRIPFLFVPKGADVQVFPKLIYSTNSTRPEAASLPAYVWLLSSNADDVVAIMDAQTGLFVSSIAVPTRPINLALSNDGERAYVTHLEVDAGNPFFPQSPPRISVLGKSTRSIVNTINLPVGKTPGKPVLSPDDQLLYVPNAGTFVSPVGYQNASVMVIDTQSRAVVGEVPLNTTGAAVNHLVVTPDGALVYGIQAQSSPLRLFTIDTFLREISATLTLSGAAPTDMLVDRTGTHLYILTSSTLIVIDTTTNTESGRLLIRQNGRLNSLALSFDGGSLFVNDELVSKFYRVDTATLRVVEEIDPQPGSPNPDSSRIFMVP